MASKVSLPIVTSQIPKVRFDSKRGHFWFVFMKLSEIVGFSCVEHHSLHKVFFYIGTNYFSVKVFRQKKNFHILLHLTLNPLNTDKLRMNATFRQHMAFFGHFHPNFIPILKKSAF